MVEIKNLELSSSCSAELPEPFSAPFVKIERAKHHIKSLELLAEQYIASNPATVAVKPALVEREGNRVHATFAIEWTVQAIPSEASAIMGDVFHNLRSSLDIVLCEFCKSDQVRFPFCDKEIELKAMIDRRTCGRAGANGERLLTELKPYKGGNKALRAIHDLNIQDKHKLLIPGGTALTLPPIRIAGPDGKPLLDAQGEPAPQIIGDPNKPFGFNLVFPPDSPLAGEPLIPTLHHLVHTAASIVESFKLLGSPSSDPPISGNITKGIW
jgi:hypothetical protein